MAKTRSIKNVLSPGEWESLLSGSIPDAYRGLIRRLAIHHGVLPAETCPTCGKPKPQQFRGGDAVR